MSLLFLNKIQHGVAGWQLSLGLNSGSVTAGTFLNLVCEDHLMVHIAMVWSTDSEPGSSSATHWCDFGQVLKSVSAGLPTPTL